MWDKALLYCRQAGTKAAGRPAYREAVASFEQALVPCSIFRRAVRRWSGPSSSGSTCAMCSCRLEIGADLRPLARGGDPRPGLGRSPAAGAGLRLYDRILQADARPGPVPSSPGSARSRSRQPMGMSACRSWRISIWDPSTMIWGTTVGRSTSSGGTWRPSKAT